MVGAILLALSLPFALTLPPNGITVGGGQVAAQFADATRMGRQGVFGALTRRAANGSQTIALFEIWAGPVMYRMVVIRPKPGK
ncbi:MAG: hypothetical protein ACO1SX_23860 [Actinomycetota bacterium]